MTRPRVFLDTGIVVAALNRRDRHHDAAMDLFGGPVPRWHTSALVWSEACAWFLQRGGEASAARCRRFLEELAGLEVLEATAGLQYETSRMLERLDAPTLTWVDASSLAFMEAADIRVVWATDRHLGLTGAEVLPRL